MNNDTTGHPVHCDAHLHGRSHYHARLYNLHPPVHGLDGCWVLLGDVRYCQRCSCDVLREAHPAQSTSGRKRTTDVTVNVRPISICTVTQRQSHRPQSQPVSDIFECLSGSWASTRGLMSYPGQRRRSSKSRVRHRQSVGCTHVVLASRVWRRGQNS